MKILFFIGLIILVFFVVGCEDTLVGQGSEQQEEMIELTQEEWGEIAKANDYCNSLDYFEIIDDWNECRDGQLSWSTESRYNQFKVQQEAKSQQAAELRQKQLDVDDKMSYMEEKLGKGIEVKSEEYWNLDKLKEFKPQLNAKLEIPVNKISTDNFKEDDIRIFYLFWKKDEVLNSQEQIKADFISSLRTAVQEIKNTGEFEVIIVYVFEGETIEQGIGDLQINVFKVNENTDYNQVVTLGSGIFKR